MSDIYRYNLSSGVSLSAWSGQMGRSCMAARSWRRRPPFLPAALMRIKTSYHRRAAFSCTFNSLVGLLLVTMALSFLLVAALLAHTSGAQQFQSNAGLKPKRWESVDGSSWGYYQTVPNPIGTAVRAAGSCRRRCRSTHAAPVVLHPHCLSLHSLAAWPARDAGPGTRSSCCGLPGSLHLKTTVPLTRWYPHSHAMPHHMPHMPARLPACCSC